LISLAFHSVVLRTPVHRLFNGGRPARRPSGRCAVQNCSRQFCRPLRHLSDRGIAILGSNPLLVKYAK